MQKIFVKKMLLFISIAAVFTIAFVFFMQSWIARSNAESNAENLIGEIGRKVAENQQEIEEIKQTLDADGLSKAHAFAFMIAQNPALLEDAARLRGLCKLLGVDGLCVSDEQGVLRWGTDYIGFDMNSSEQSRPFMGALQDSNFELAQEPQINGAKKQLSQFVGVARQDRPGIVQIELHPERLEKALARNQIQNLLSGYAIGSSGFVIAVRSADGTVAAHKDAAWIGKSAQEAGLPEEKSGSGFAEIGGVEMYYTAGACGDWTLYAALPKAELYQDRNLQIALFFAVLVLIFALLVFKIKEMLGKLIISGIEQLGDSLRRITSGDLSHVVAVRNTEEFERLSDGINKMVGSIKTQMKETEMQVQETQTLLEGQQTLVQEVQASFQEVKDSSEQMHGIAQQIREGAEKQRLSVTKLLDAVAQVSAAAQESAASAGESAKAATRTDQHMRQNQAEMGKMVDAMKEINESSAKIGAVIQTVQSIAEQTNILAINASIEAARAGEMGKGFAVVASEVAKLAAQSTEAAKETQQLVEATLHSNAAGTQLLDGLAQNFETVLEEVRHSNAVMKEIGETAEIAAQQLESITQEAHGVSEIAASNVSVSQSSAEVAEHLLQRSQQIDETIRAR